MRSLPFLECHALMRIPTTAIGPVALESILKNFLFGSFMMLLSYAVCLQSQPEDYVHRLLMASGKLHHHASSFIYKPMVVWHHNHPSNMLVLA